MGRVRDALLHHSDRGRPPEEATPDGNNSLYCFNFLTQRGHRLGRKVLGEVANVARPDTILAWYRKLVARKFDGSKACPWRIRKSSHKRIGPGSLL